jgi:alkane 1-monooxygenase
MKDFKYMIAYIVPFSGWLALEKGGLWSWSTVILAFGIIPVLDAVIPTSDRNIPVELEANYSKTIFFDLLLFICAPICMFLTYSYLATVQKGMLSLSELIGLTLSIGIVLGATGINVAHELGHRTDAFSQFLAKLGLLFVLYQHFFIEHNRGHHKNVATLFDPATARRNEMVYVFFFRSIIGQYFGAWQLEKERLIRENKSFLSWNNEMIRYLFFQGVYLLVVGLYFGMALIPFAIAIAVVGILLLEIINYIEHYGLQRKILASGRPERVLPKHSWNSDHEMGRILLFELTRHSDHHYKSTRKYQILRHMEDSLQLPLGYPGSMLLALIPPLWFAVINNRIIETDECNSAKK